MGISPTDLEARIAAMAADRTFTWVDRFGLPTFFALLMFGLACFMAYTNYQQNIEFAKSNVAKIEMLGQILKNQDDIKLMVHEVHNEEVQIREKEDKVLDLYGRQSQPK